MSEVQETGFVPKRVKQNHYSSQEKKPNSYPEDETSQKESGETSSTAGEKNKTSDFSSLVAAHYNSIEDSDQQKRNDSRIIYLRNFNNWIKTILIKESVWEFPEQNRRNLKVLDLCCGKGGDLFKWAKLDVRYMVCADIAENSLKQFKNRYYDHLEVCQRNRRLYPMECEFIPADCTRVRLRAKYQDPSIRFDIVSCQFSFHYCFESLPQAECMLKNATECLRPGGLFIGTIPNANEIVKRLRESKTNSFKNDIFAIEMCCSEPYPLFGAEYHFYLEGVVNCPEFLVHFPTFERLAEKHGLKLVHKEKFTDCFERKRKTRDGEILLKIIKALETYPPHENKKPVGPSTDYIHARIFCEQNAVRQVGTLSKSEWEDSLQYFGYYMWMMRLTLGRIAINTLYVYVCLTTGGLKYAVQPLEYLHGNVSGTFFIPKKFPSVFFFLSGITVFHNDRSKYIVSLDEGKLTDIIHYWEYCKVLVLTSLQPCSPCTLTEQPRLHHRL